MANITFSAVYFIDIDLLIQSLKDMQDKGERFVGIMYKDKDAGVILPSFGDEIELLTESDFVKIAFEID